MKKLFIALSVLIIIISTSSAQELDHILYEHYKAAAQEKMQNVETIISTGKHEYVMAGSVSTFKIYQSRPNKLRIEADFRGAKFIQTFDGSLAWKYAPSMGFPEPTEIKGFELEALLSQIEFENPLWKYDERGATIEIEPHDDTSADHLVLTTSDGDVHHFLIDRETHLINSKRTSHIIGGSETGIEFQMKEYKSIKGIPFAHRVHTKMNGQVVATLQFESIELNRKIDPSLFEKPEIQQ